VTRIRPEAMLAAAFFWLLALLVVPLPALVLDLMLSFSITVSLLVLLVAIYAERPIEFSVFPSLLLMVTLMRLGLNVASTRLILLHGADGSDAAGRVIRAFGEFTVGGSYVVGIVLFVIFVVINFVVITKGAGRIAEVAARFALDAMPGKQMAIDADLNQGVIDDAEATRRRREVQRESDFFGAMDGASKFVRGDAIAGIVILGVNLLGGVVIGALQHGMPLASALQTYALLTVGDGLVAQVPALVVSTAAGVVVSRAAGGASLAEELSSQLVLQPRALNGVATMLAGLALVPGLPFLPFATLAAGAAALSRVASRRRAAELVPTPIVMPAAESEESDVRRALALDDLELEIGYSLIPLVDGQRGGDLLQRIRATRKQLAGELGFVVPLIHVRDNLQLEPGAYTVLIRGNPVASGQIPSNRLLALRPDADAPPVPGIETRDPAFGLPAVWVQPRDRERAVAAGYAVVDAATALATHLAEVVRAHAASLLTRAQVRELLDDLSQRMPKVVEEIVPAVVPIATLHRVLRQLLQERVSIRDLGSILETLGELVPRVQDPDLLTDCVRERLARTVTRPYVDAENTLHVITFAPELEEKLRAGVHRTENGSFLALDPKTLDGLARGLERAVQESGSADGRGPVLLASQALRSSLRPILARVAPRLALISHNELPPDVRVVGEAVLGGGDAH
jgi:flagellar biosynthesis protein FlhA